MIDPQTQIALSVFSNKGVYALMLGSGISRSAGIPTGWEVVLDLINKVAAAEGEDAGSAPDAWYTAKYGATPDYSNLLEMLGGTPSERQRLLRSYFEPTSDEERDRGLKQPTKAHKAIAELARDGYIRVVITTNFDQLLEQALRAVGVAPTIISSVDGLKGATPLPHTDFTIVKVHGDYLDTRIRNTPNELAAYDKELDALLDRIVDEYGIIVSGWSADYDPALCKAFLRAPSRRFTTFWSYKGRLGAEAQKVIDQRRATTTEVDSADGFFSGLLESVRSLESVARPHPLTKQIAVASLKRYLSDRRAIDLHDLIMREVENVIAITSNFDYPSSISPDNDRTIEFLQQRLAKYEGAEEALLDLLAVLGYWASPDDTGLIVKAIERIANVAIPSGILNVLERMAMYPALLALYALGVSSTASNNWDVLIKLLTAPQINQYRASGMPATSLNTYVVVESANQNSLFGNFFVPFSEYLFQKLRLPLSDLLRDDKKYEEAFNKFEYLLALFCAHYKDKAGSGIGMWGPPGRFGWSGSRVIGVGEVMPSIKAEIAEASDAWPPLKAGIFDGSTERLITVMASVDGRISKMGLY